MARKRPRQYNKVSVCQNSMLQHHAWPCAMHQLWSQQVLVRTQSLLQAAKAAEEARMTTCLALWDCCTALHGGLKASRHTRCANFLQKSRPLCTIARHAVMQQKLEHSAVI